MRTDRTGANLLGANRPPMTRIMLMTGALAAAIAAVAIAAPGTPVPAGDAAAASGATEALGGSMDSAGVATEPLSLGTVWEFATKGGIMMIPLAICSLVAFAVTVERFVLTRRSQIVPPQFERQFNEQVPSGTRHISGDALSWCERAKSPVGRIMASVVIPLQKHPSIPVSELRRRSEESAAREVFTIRRRFRVLSVIAAVAPLLGLLGTILGMITAFRTVATSGDALGRTELLAEGIYEAMITTAAGLVVAIPSLIAYHWLSGRVQRHVAEIDRVASTWLDDLPPDHMNPVPHAHPHHTEGTASITASVPAGPRA